MNIYMLGSARSPRSHYPCPNVCPLQCDTIKVSQSSLLSLSLSKIILKSVSALSQVSGLYQVSFSFSSLNLLHMTDGA